MSIPYLVHKEDADLYDANEKIMEPLREELRAFERTLTEEDYGPTGKYEDFRKSLDIKFKAVYDSLKMPRCIGAFEPQPADLENYYTYYRGHRWGEAKSCEMMDVAHKGIEACKKAIKGEP